MTELDELKQRLEIEELRGRLDAAEKRIAILTDTLSTLTDMQTSEQLKSYINSQVRLLRTAEFLNSVTETEKLDVDKQRRSAEDAALRKAELDAQTAERVKQSREQSLLASDSRIAEALGRWQSRQPESGYETALKYLTYRVEHGEVTITGFNTHHSFDGEVETPPVLSIPDVIDGCTVTRIGDGAFRACKLKRLVLPEHLYYIGKDAFCACTLTELRFPDALMSIGAGAFASCRFTEIHLENTRVTVLPEKCFGWCSALKKVVLPDTLSGIENNAFVECGQLMRLVIPENTQTVVSPFSDFFLNGARAVAVVGMDTELVDICGILMNSAAAKKVVVYCLPDSAAQKYCLENGVPCRHLSEFPAE